MGEPTDTKIIPDQEIETFNFADFKAGVEDAIDSHNESLDERDIPHDSETDAKYAEVKALLSKINCSTEDGLKTELLTKKSDGSLSEAAYDFIIDNL